MYITRINNRVDEVSLESHNGTDAQILVNN